MAIDFIAAKAKQRYNKKYKLVSFKVGDKVYLRLYNSYYLPGKPAKKLLQ